MPHSKENLESVDCTGPAFDERKLLSFLGDLRSKLQQRKRQCPGLTAEYEREPEDPDMSACRLFEQVSPEAVACCLYLMAEDGRLLAVNQALCDTMGLARDELQGREITDFCTDQLRRDELQAGFKKVKRSGRCSPGEPIELQVGAQRRHFRTTIGALKEPGSDRVVGYLGCLVDVTEQEQQYRLFEHLQIGIYRLDYEDRIVSANSALAEILGYRTADQVVGRLARDFYANPEEADALKRHVEQAHRHVKEVKELVRQDGQLIYASISSVAIRDAEGYYQGREGTLVDVTREERYRRSLDDVPVGFYEVRTEQGQDLITQCNRQFAEMFEFGSRQEVQGSNIRELYSSTADYYEFQNQILTKDREGLPLLGYPLSVKTRKGQQFTIEVNSRLLRDRTGRVVGRTGIVRDITEEHRLRTELKTLQNDIGQVLHGYTSALVMIRHKVLPALTCLGPDPFDKRRLPSPSEIDRQLQGPASLLIASLTRLAKEVQVDLDRTGSRSGDWDRLAALSEALLGHLQTFYPEFRPPVLHLTAQEILELCGTTLRDKLPQAALDDVLRDAEEVRRVTALVGLRQIEAEAIEMDHQIRALRDYVTAGARSAEKRGIFMLQEIVRQAVGNLEEFAGMRGVTIQLTDASMAARVEVVHRDVVRALGNLLHNAIKYSWSRKKGSPPWVEVRTVAKADRVLVEFENYGVPIPHDELESGLVFELGYRGRFSSDRGRLGTGIGLTDALNVARMHGGQVTIASHPASLGAPPDTCDVPHITTAAFMLPRYRSSEEKHGREG